MDERRASRVGGVCGLVFAALSLVVVPLVAAPATPPAALGASGETFAAWYVAHRAGFLVGNYLGIAAFIPGFVQLAVLAARIRAREARTDGALPWLSGLLLASGTFTYAVFGCSLVAFQAMPFLLDPAAPQASLAMGTLTSVWFALDGLAALPMLLAVAWAVAATGFLPRWVAWLSGAVAALALLMSVGALFDAPPWLAAGGPATFLGFVAFFAWTGALAVAMMRPPPA
ncbi:MAG TPA: hypothetical protein PLR99_01080 [Polyangiaceae bacterium]|nr:hypothetical protein [Polyangiaceae bacterium]